MSKVKPSLKTRKDVLRSERYKYGDGWNTHSYKVIKSE